MFHRVTPVFGGEGDIAAGNVDFSLAYLCRKLIYFCPMDLLLPKLEAFGWTVFAILLIFVLYTLYHILTKLPSGRGNPKLAWVLMVVLMPFVGALAYFFFGRPKKSQSVGVK